MWSFVMSVKSAARAFAAAAVAGFVLTSLPAGAQAQGLFDNFWGGTPQNGGQRQMVSFDQKHPAGQVIVSFGDRRLYLVTRPGQAISYPIAVPREKSRWSGVTSVSMKRENPDWTPTAEMRAENPRLPPWVPGGHPMNPLGNRALYLGSSTYRIHGTDAPWTIGQAVSKGCIRMFNHDVADLYPRVPVGTKVIVTWDRFTTSGNFAEADQAVQQRPQSAASGYWKAAGQRPVVIRQRPALPAGSQKNAQLE
jgi:lipoprotein-anchoring transpeptidase ErfK/SrfK